MPQPIETGNTVSSNDTTGNCSTVPGIIQLALGILLITASAFGYTLMYHPALLIPAVMGSVLLFPGVQAVLVCRGHSAYPHHHPGNGMTG